MKWQERAPGAPGARPEVEPRRTDGGERAIRCRACGSQITTAAEKVSVAGAHEHTRFNPGGHVFRFGCFRAAPGCLVEGDPTGDATWFSGHRWRYALCAACAEHLGWWFEGEGTFFGLVLEKLAEE